ncbi:MAG: NIPSNAP family protein [Candidatus Solibacter usitatus]|nr:NIPSNAP family protein [Candidatus Solibacter usitatus]
MGGQRANAAGKNRVYELRTYTANDGKLGDLQSRFRNHTMAIFEKHGMKNVWYGVPQDGPTKDNTLTYLLSFESRDQAKQAWAAFRDDPDWKKAAAASEVNGRLVKKVESVYFDPTDYSPLK